MDRRFRFLILDVGLVFGPQNWVCAEFQVYIPLILLKTRFGSLNKGLIVMVLKLHLHCKMQNQ